MSNVVLLKPTSPESPSVASTKDKWDKADRASDEAEQLYIEIGHELKAHKERKPKDVTWADYVRQHFDRGYSRADELIAAAEGRTTMAEIRQKANERKIKHRAKQSPFRNGDDDESQMGKTKTLVFDCIKEHGPITDEEMQDQLGMGSSTQRPRRVELWDAGLIEQCGTQETKSGRTAALWRVKEEGDTTIPTTPNVSALNVSPTKATPTVGGKISIPKGTTVEAQVRRGMKLEEGGSSQSDAAKEVGISQLGYRRIRELIVLFDEVEIEAADKHVVRSALTAINQTRQINGYEQAEPLVLKVWGAENNKTLRTAKGAKKRLEIFDTVAGNVAQTCELLANFEFPYLTEEKKWSWVDELKRAKRDLDAAINQLTKERG